MKVLQTRYLAGLFAIVIIAASKVHGSILPDNHLYLMDCLECETGIGKEEFERVIDKTKEVFTPIVSDFGETLEIVNKWEDSTVNASAIQSFGKWTVNMYGGLARRREVTADGFALVLCHELGHHLAGFPFSSGWAANEGQSDYFATNHCAPRLWKDDVEVNATFKEVVPEEPKAQCLNAYQDENSQNLCFRIMLASKSISDLLASLSGSQVSFDRKDTKQVGKTSNSHPAAQCRLDTYVAGSLCTLDYDPTVIPGKSGSRGANNLEAETESSRVNCARVEEFLGNALRPRCWFKPNLE